MRILTRYTVSSVLRIAITTLLMFALILAAVELFSKMDQIMHSEASPVDIVFYIIVSLPEYLLMAASISFLFAVTYFLSSLSANNEMIPILNAGISPARLRLPIVVLAVIATLLGVVFQEHTVISAANLHDELETELFGASSTRDTRNIVLTDDDGFIIYTQRFREATGEISSPVLVRSRDGRIEERVEAASARFDEGKGYWVFSDARIYTIEGNTARTRTAGSYEDPLFDPEPRLFRSQNTSVETMDREAARAYLSRLWDSDRTTWQEKATDYYRRLASPLAIFVLMFISVSMNFSFRRNVLLFAIIQSLSIAVIYYVADMVFSIMGHQGAVAPIVAVIMPIVMTILLSLVISMIGRRA